VWRSVGDVAVNVVVQVVFIKNSPTASISSTSLNIIDLYIYNVSDQQYWYAGGGGLIDVDAIERFSPPIKAQRRQQVSETPFHWKDRYNR
jgi:hypothetical protein